MNEKVLRIILNMYKRECISVEEATTLIKATFNKEKEYIYYPFYNASNPYITKDFTVTYNDNK
jgi:hypothetical protein